MTVKTSPKPFPEMEFIELNSFSLGSFSRNVALNQLGVGRDGQFPLCKGFLCFQEASAEDVLLPSRSLSTGETAAPGQPEAFYSLPPAKEQWSGGQSTGKVFNCHFSSSGWVFVAFLSGSVPSPAGEQSQPSLFVSSSLGVTSCAVLCKEPNTLCLNKAKQQTGALQGKRWSL